MDGQVYYGGHGRQDDQDGQDGQGGQGGQASQGGLGFEVMGGLGGPGGFRHPSSSANRRLQETFRRRVPHATQPTAR